MAKYSSFNADDFGKKLTYFREKKGLTKTELAKRIKVAPSTISGYESGDREPSYGIINKLGFVLNVDPIEFFLNTDGVDMFNKGKARNKFSSLKPSQQNIINELIKELTA